MKKYSAPVIWMLALLFLFILDPTQDLVSFCLFKFIGFTSCLGCGIGTSIHHALHLQFTESLQEHILGIPATLVILYSVYQSFTAIKQTTAHGPTTTNAYDAA